MNSSRIGRVSRGDLREVALCAGRGPRCDC